MRDLADFLSHVMPHAIGCPEPAALRALNEAARQWCMRTRMWRATDCFQTTGSDIESVSVPPGAAIYEIEQAWFDGRALEAMRFDRLFGGTRDQDGGRLPDFITTAEANSIMLRPRGTGELRISMFMMPAPDADQVPDALFERHAQDIAHGALAQLKLLPNQPYSDPQMAVYFRQQFEAAMNSNFAANLRGQQRAHVRTRPRFL